LSISFNERDIHAW